NEAMTMLEGNPVDFVISDWEMPGSTGIDLLNRMRADDRFKHIPFVMVTAPVSQERDKVEQAGSLGVDEYVIKPFRSQTLQEKIHEALAKANIRGRKAVLLVDDDNDSRAAIKEYIEAMGYGPIYEAADGEAGFALLRQKGIEIAFVMSDWEMPRLAGIDLLRQIRKDPEFSRMPFIMVTSQTSIERLKIEQALDLNVDHYLLKPFRSADLRDKVEHVLKKAKANFPIERDLTRADECLLLYRWDDAILAFKQVLDIDPRCVRALIGLGIAHRGMGDEKSTYKGVQFFRKAISISPTCEEAHLELAFTFEHSRAVDHAIDVLKQATTLCVFSDKIRLHLGRLLLMRGADVEGREQLKKALEINPGLDEAKALLAGRDPGQADEAGDLDDILSGKVPATDNEEPGDGQS
ncbi:MAG: response regulator, partial [Deltaproteobacteria bacterium]|nr:response regulator [Deltaproteobacteria bacterium]